MSIASRARSTKRPNGNCRHSKQPGPYIFHIPCRGPSGGEHIRPTEGAAPDSIKRAKKHRKEFLKPLHQRHHMTTDQFGIYSQEARASRISVKAAKQAA